MRRHRSQEHKKPSPTERNTRADTTAATQHRSETEPRPDQTHPQKRWIEAKTGAHHHGELESIIYVVHGEALMRWGDRLEFITKAGPGDFLHVPAWLPHQELNASTEDELHCVLVRSGPEELVVNLELEVADEPEWISWD